MNFHSSEAPLNSNYDYSNISSSNVKSQFPMNFSNKNGISAPFSLNDHPQNSLIQTRTPSSYSQINQNIHSNPTQTQESEGTILILQTSSTKKSF